MGLDAVELVLEIEDAFDISISDESASKIRTVGECYELILKLKSDDMTPRNICLSAATFYLLRRELSAELQINPKTIRPATSLAATLPPKGRRQFWSNLQKKLLLKLPDLARPRMMVIVLIIMAFLASIGITYISYCHWGSKNIAAISCIVALLIFLIFGMRLTQPFAIHPHRTFETFRGLSHVTLAHNYADISRRFNSWNPADLWDALRVIVSEQLGVKPELVTKNARFVEDLSMS